MSVPANGNNCQTIIDSARALIQTGEFGINVRPTIADRQRNLRLDQWLQNLSFKNLTCLLDNEDVSLKVVGFAYATNHYSDSLLKNYSYLLTDTTSVQLLEMDGRTSSKLRLGQVLSMIARKSKEDQKNFAKRPQVENAVKVFIREYSAYPGSYKPIGFPYFSMGSDNTGITNFNIRHHYQIQNNKGKTVRVINAFVLDKDLEISVIEKDSSSYVFTYPPKLNYWLAEFGRRLSKEDSSTLKLQEIRFSVPDTRKP